MTPGYIQTLAMITMSEWSNDIPKSRHYKWGNVSKVNLTSNTLDWLGKSCHSYAVSGLALSILKETF